MRIGIDCRLFSDVHGSVGIYTQEIMDWIQNTNTEDEFVFFMNDPQYSSYEIRNPHCKKVLVNCPLRSWKEQCILPFLLKKHRCHLVHFVSENMPLFFQGDFIVTLHHLAPEFYQEKWENRWVSRWIRRCIFRKISHSSLRILVPSHQIKKEALDILNISAEKIEEISYGCRENQNISLEQQQKIYKKHQLSPGEYLLFSGTHSSYRNIPVLLHCIAELKKEEKKIRIVITGREIPGNHEIRDLVRALHLENEVQILGFIPSSELTTLRNGARGFFFPTLYEGSCLSLFEAVQAGIPISCSRISTITEYFTENQVLFFNPFRKEEIKMALWKFWTDDTLRKACVIEGKKAIQEIRWPLTGQKIILAYKKALRLL